MSLERFRASQEAGGEMGRMGRRKVNKREADFLLPQEVNSPLSER